MNKFTLSTLAAALMTSAVAFAQAPATPAVGSISAPVPVSSTAAVNTMAPKATVAKGGVHKVGVHKAKAHKVSKKSHKKHAHKAKKHGKRAAKHV
jgi:hypothetical protein